MTTTGDADDDASAADVGRLTVDDITRVCAALGGTPAGWAPLSGGVSATIVRVDIDIGDGTGTRAVIRQPGAAAWKHTSRGTAAREYALLAHLHAAGLAVPAPLWYDASAAHPFYVMEHVGGDGQLPDDAPEQAARFLAQLHRLPIPVDVELGRLEDPAAEIGAYLPPGHDELRGAVEAGAITPAERHAIVHGDFWPGNIMWSDSTIAAVLDWEDTTVGDPLADVACARLEMRYDWGREAAERFSTTYAELCHTDTARLAVWDAYVAAAALHSMSDWGLAADVEAHRRREATRALDEASATIIGQQQHGGPHRRA